MSVPLTVLPQHTQTYEPMPGERVYRLYVSEGRTETTRAAVSSARIRAVVCAAFRMWFGAPCSFEWAIDGCSAEAWDDHGRRMHVVQIHYR